MTIYQDNGYRNRADYLNSLAREYGLTRKAVYNLALILGEDEDFDLLITTIENHAEFFGMNDELVF